MKKITNALISVYDKENLEVFARGLLEERINIISTGGTAKILRKAGIATTKVEDVTNFPEILDGRVKTLNPRIHGGILAVRTNKKHIEVLERFKIPQVDLVVVNLYPFEKIREKSCGDENQIIEGIDIGGSSLIRAAAKNFQDVIVVVDPNDYQKILNQIKQKRIDLNFRRELAKKAFQHTCYYDGAIFDYFLNCKNGTDRFQINKGLDSDTILLHLKKIKQLKYGENPHQKANVYVNLRDTAGQTMLENQIQGGEVSFNNLLDIETASRCANEVEGKCCVIVKHNNPCGAAIGESLLQAFLHAKACDPVSFFGGVVAFNHEIGEELAEILTTYFLEAVIAPSIDSKAATIFQKKKNLRVFSYKAFSKNTSNDLDIRRVNGLFLAQEPDSSDLGKVLFDPHKDMKSVTSTSPSRQQIKDANFAWHIAKFVKSNAVVLCKNQKTIGIGAGQMSRIDATKIAIQKAIHNQFDLNDAVVASDAFFPFKDNIEEIAKSGASCIIQPGGSIKDGEVVAAAEELGLSMILTKVRHFRH